MANLEKYTNIYADLAQGAYIGRKEGFMFAKLTQVQKDPYNFRIVQRNGMINN